MSGRWKTWNWPEKLDVSVEMWVSLIQEISTTTAYLFPLHPLLSHAVLSCPVLFCPLPPLQEEQESINRLVSVADVTVLYGPVILQGLVWRECRTKDRHAERISPVVAHGGIQSSSISCKLLLYQRSRNAKPTTKCSLNQSHGSTKLGYSCMELLKNSI